MSETADKFKGSWLSLLPEDLLTALDQAVAEGQRKGESKEQLSARVEAVLLRQKANPSRQPSVFFARPTLADGAAQQLPYRRGE